jgi:hypothetical protein
MRAFTGFAALVGSLALGQLRPGPGTADVWEEYFFDRFHLFMHKTATVFDPDFVGKNRAGKSVWEFWITDELLEGSPQFTGSDTFNQGRAAAVRWAVSRHNRSMFKVPK